MIYSTAPGKLIITGEHSVVYGAPAYAAAIECHIKAYFKSDLSNQFSMSFCGDSLDHSYSCDSFFEVSNDLEARYQEFEEGRRSITSLLDNPTVLMVFVISQLLRKANRNVSSANYPSLSAVKPILTGGVLYTESTMPIGSGMGSSAAAICAVTILFETLLGVHLTKSERFESVRSCERLVHGKGSLIDASTVTLGGLISVQNSKILPLGYADLCDWYWINTGTPKASTGECVASVKSQFEFSNIWLVLEKVSTSIFQQMSQMNSIASRDDRDWVSASNKLIEKVRLNHRLLTEIGVVPEVVCEFISQIEWLGGAAKISGAGSITGDAAGIVLAYIPDFNPANLCKLKGFEWDVLKVNRNGASLL